MKAAILKAPGVLELDDMPDPECPKGGALIKVLACAVCGTDVKMLKDGHKDLAYPRILGHEIVGRLVEIDRDCGLEIGDMVQVWPGIACGRCRPCQREEDNRCQKMKILGFNQDGGFAELMALPSQCIPNGLNPLPEKTDPGIAALAEPLACCINGQDYGQGLERRLRPDLWCRSPRLSSRSAGKTPWGREDHCSRKIGEPDREDQETHRSHGNWPRRVSETNSE